MRGSPSDRILRLGLAALTGFAIAGCSWLPGFEAAPSPSPGGLTTPTPVPTETPLSLADRPEGWMEYEPAGDGFALALPGSWQGMDVDPQTLPALLQMLGVSRPELLGSLANVSGLAAERGVCFFALDMAAEGLASGFAANLTVLHRPLDAPTSLDEYAQSNVRELHRFGGAVQPVGQERVQMPAGPALRLCYDLAVDADQGQEIRLSVTQLLLIHGQEGYVLTFATTPSQMPKHEPVFEEIGRSFRWLDD